MAVFYVCYVVGLGCGSALLGFLDIANAEAPLVGIVFTALSILPVGMTRLAQPPAPEGATVALAPRLAHLAGRRRRHAGGRRPVDDDRRLCADPRHGQGLFAAGSGDAAVCHAARHADVPDSASAGSPTAPTAATCWLRPRCWSSIAGLAASRFDHSPLIVVIAIYVSGAARRNPSTRWPAPTPMTVPQRETW